MTMNTFAVSPIKREVRVHTGMSLEVKKKIEALSKETGLPQATIINSLLTRALAKK